MRARFGALVVLAMLGVPGAAWGAPPPCSYPYWDADAAALLSVPSSVFAGRTYDIEVDSSASMRMTAVRVSVQAAGPQPISHPLERASAPGLFGSNALRKVPLRLESGDGPALVTVAWDNYGLGCRVTVSRRVELLQGSPPALDVEIVPSHAYARTNVVKWSFDTSDSPEGELALTVRSRYSKALRMRTWSDGSFPAWQSDRLSRRGVLVLSGRSSSNTATVLFENRIRVPTTYTVFYTETFDAGKIKSGSFLVHVKHTKGTKGKVGHRIYQDTDFDSYINFCINGGREIWSEHGRLYCWSIGKFGKAPYTYSYITRLR